MTLSNVSGESNIYTLGNIGAHRVVCTKLPTVGRDRSASIAAGNTTTRLLGTWYKICKYLKSFLIFLLNCIWSFVFFLISYYIYIFFSFKSISFLLFIFFSRILFPSTSDSGYFLLSTFPSSCSIHPNFIEFCDFI